MTIATIICPAHGESGFVYVCSHLIGNPAQKWHCGYPEKDAAWRDAWCAVCNEVYEREGGWNAMNEGEVEIDVICGHCYEGAMAQSITCLDDARQAEWTHYLETLRKAEWAQPGAMTDVFGLRNYPVWDCYQRSAQLVFIHGDHLQIVADVEFVGTHSTDSNTWTWSWANFDLLEPVRSRIAAFRDFGEQRAYPRLTVPTWRADHQDAKDMTVVAADVLRGIGCFAIKTDGGYHHMVVMSVKRRE
ncbi:DUF6882 domain-containing protein [Duganella sp. Root198D2]|uniref:DUF6882 domain-containing protein n=1 Tax=Duganella sp. Root198D2 TaxID=1736489 RepID=UPI00138F30FC|nr:DUF6882 domain-containing protein [Duganella sp. Root198D2]